MAFSPVSGLPGIVSLACAIRPSVLAGIAPSLFEGIARRLGLFYRRPLSLARPARGVGPDVDAVEISGLSAYTPGTVR
jgi:hypothetical protein